MHIQGMRLKIEGFVRIVFPCLQIMILVVIKRSLNIQKKCIKIGPGEWNCYLLKIYGFFH